MKLIDATELLKHEVEADKMGAMLVVGKGHILNAKFIDAVEVMRCCDCKHGKVIPAEENYIPCLYCSKGCGHWISVDYMDYCSWAEREVENESK